MDLNELVPSPGSKKIAQVANKIFGYAIDVDGLTETKAKKLHKNVSETLSVMESREGARAFNNKQFQELRIAKQALEARLTEGAVDEADVDEDNAFNSAAAAAKKAGKSHFTFNGKKYPVKMDKETADDLSESVITEGEVENAELVLAAKDMVDRVQKMLEDIGKMINEDLPPLTDAIRDEMDSTTADSFNSSMSTALNSLLDNLSTARTGVDEASRVLTGDTPAEPMGAEEPGEVTAPDAEADDFGAADAAVGGEEPMGREKAGGAEETAGGEEEETDVFGEPA